MSWLDELARADGVTVEQAVAYLVEGEVSIGSTRWAQLTRKQRALVVAARRAARITHLEEQGQDLAAARAYAPVDGGARAARLLAQSAARGVQQALRRSRRGAGG